MRCAQAAGNETYELALKALERGTPDLATPTSSFMQFGSVGDRASRELTGKRPAPLETVLVESRQPPSQQGQENPEGFFHDTGHEGEELQ